MSEISHNDDMEERQGDAMKITVSDVLHEADLMRPNAVDKTLKMKFLNQIEAEIFDYYEEFYPAAEELISNIEARNDFWKEKPERDPDDGSLPGRGEGKATVSVPAEGGMDLGNPLNLAMNPPELATVRKFRPYEDTEDDAVMLLDSRFSEVYTSYIKAKLDYLEDETANYVNDVQMHNAEKEAWISWMQNTHRRKTLRARGLV